MSQRHFIFLLLSLVAIYVCLHASEPPIVPGQYSGAVDFYTSDQSSVKHKLNSASIKILENYDFILVTHDKQEFTFKYDEGEKVWRSSFKKRTKVVTFQCHLETFDNLHVFHIYTPGDGIIEHFRVFVAPQKTS